MKTDVATEVFWKWQDAGSPIPFDTSARRGPRRYKARIYNDDEGKLRLRISDRDKPMLMELYLGKLGVWEIVEDPAVATNG